MKKILLLFSASILVLASCKKYQEGPSFTLLGKKARLANTWALEAFYENDENKTSDAQSIFKDFTLVLDKNNMKYTKTFMAFGLLSYSETGAWNLSGDKMNVDFTPDQSAVKPYSWKIIKLKSKNSGFSYIDNGKTYRVYLRQK